MKWFKNRMFNGPLYNGCRNILLQNDTDTMQCDYLHNCIILWDSIQTNITSSLLLPHAGDCKQGIFSLCACVS